MKNVILAATLVAISAVSASAQEAAPVPLSSHITTQILNWVPDADLSNLTNSQYARLVALFTSSENLRAGEDPVNQVRVILNAL